MIPIVIVLLAEEVPVDLLVLILGVPFAFILGGIVAFLWAREVSRRFVHVSTTAREYRPGEVVTGSVELHVGRPLDLKSLRVRVWGGERVRMTISVGRFTRTIGADRPVVEERLRLEPQVPAAPLDTGGRTSPLPSGIHRYRFAFRIPSDALASWERGGVGVRYFIEAQARVKHWFDAGKEYDITVLPTTRSPRGSPRSFRSEESVDRPALHLNVNSDEVVRGDRLSGHVSLHNLGGREVRGVDLRLVEEGWGKVGEHETTPRHVLERLEVTPIGEPRGPLPFTIPVPEGAHLSTSGTITALHQYLEGRADIALGKDVRARGEILVVG